VAAGLCAAAVGTKTTNGTIDARSITLSAPHNGTCPARALGSFGAGRFGFGGRGGPGSGQGSSSAPVSSA
jgi:hypothetical protein